MRPGKKYLDKEYIACYNKWPLVRGHINKRSLCLETARQKEREVLFVFAIMEVGGKQYKVSEGDVVYLEKMDVEAGETVKFDKVLAVSDNDSFQAGTPTVDGAFVEANVVKNGKSPKIVVFRYKSKKNEKKKQGHRQPYTKVQITKISL